MEPALAAIRLCTCALSCSVLLAATSALPAKLDRVCSAWAPDASTDTSPAFFSCVTSNAVMASATLKSDGASSTVMTVSAQVWAPSESTAHTYRVFLPTGRPLKTKVGAGLEDTTWRASLASFTPKSNLQGCDR
jgi:hypothetical protein